MVTREAFLGMDGRDTGCRYIGIKSEVVFFVVVVVF